MDIQDYKQVNEVLSNNLNNMKQKYNDLINSAKNKNTQAQNKNSGAILAKKGDAGYVEGFDLDGDGQITLEEFNEYCDKNGISSKEKMKLLSLMQGAKASAQITEKTAEGKKKINKETNEENAQTTADDTSIYARKGDEKYNPEMDSNHNDVVTHQEYIEYCNKNSKQQAKGNSDEQKAVRTYTQNENYNDEPEIEVETEA